MKWIVRLFVLLIAIAAIALVGFRTRKNLQKKRNRANVFAIQNLQTHTNLRPLDAGIKDQTPLILYPHHDWECQTWEFIRIGPQRFLLKNLYTEKTFEPSTEPTTGSLLWQRSLGEGPNQVWVCEPQAGGSYSIRLDGTSLYLTAGSSQTNARVTLAPLQSGEAQRWALLRQNPII